LRTVLRDIRRSRAISLIDLPWTKCSRRIRPTVSTTNIPRHLLRSKAGSPPTNRQGGQFWTPIPRLRGSIFHAETQTTIPSRSCEIATDGLTAAAMRARHHRLPLHLDLTDLEPDVRITKAA